MNSTAEIKDCLIADEIQRITFLSHDELAKELINLKSKTIEQMTDEELLIKIQKN